MWNTAQNRQNNNYVVFFSVTVSWVSEFGDVQLECLVGEGVGSLGDDRQDHESTQNYCCI
jgi:hypothetical protein